VLGAPCGSQNAPAVPSQIVFDSNVVILSLGAGRASIEALGAAPPRAHKAAPPAAPDGRRRKFCSNQLDHVVEVVAYRQAEGQGPLGRGHPAAADIEWPSPIAPDQGNQYLRRKTAGDVIG